MILPTLLLGLSLVPGQGGGIDHWPLFDYGGAISGGMIAPERERWAVAQLRSVGEERPLGDPEGRERSVFDVDLEVLDGWHVARGELRAFFVQDWTRRRLGTLRAMVGGRVLVRLAPTEDGHFQIVEGGDDTVGLVPSFAIGSRALLLRVLPTGATALPKGTPDEIRFYSLWTAARSLSPSAYEPFSRDIGASAFPDTSRNKIKIKDNPALEGASQTSERTAEKDVLWLRRLSAETNPEFQMMAEYVLYRSQVEGAIPAMERLVRLAVRRPELFPDGFLRVADTEAVTEGWRLRHRDEAVWAFVPTMMPYLLRGANPLLRGDLLALAAYLEPIRDRRAELLPLLGDPALRPIALATFAKWHGKPPKDVDPLAWHAARARMTAAELSAARKAGG